MRQVLKLHPDSRCDVVTRLDVDVARPHAGALVLRYCVTGEISALRMPRPAAPPAAPIRADKLWEHTCFEVFLRASPDAAYCEFNLAPSAQWAAYRFSGYRSGMSVAREIGAPRIEVQASAAAYTLQASLDLDSVPGLPGDAAWRLGLAAVIEETSGRKSYWALAHPPGKADFHHADCFTLELPAA